jgi:hypothetical protein
MYYMGYVRNSAYDMMAFLPSASSTSLISLDRRLTSIVQQPVSTKLSKRPSERTSAINQLEPEKARLEVECQLRAIALEEAGPRLRAHSTIILSS